MQLNISKGHGTGNDFVLFTDPDASVDLTDERVRWLADRHVGVGADGVIRAVRSSSMDDIEVTPAVWFMDYRNADGSVSEMCGNGVRVFAKYLLEERLVEPDADGAIEIGTRAGTKRVIVGADADGADEFSVAMGEFTIGDDLALVSSVGLDVARPALSVNVGNPHLVVTLAEESELERLQLAVPPKTDPEPADGANIEFTVPGDISDDLGEITMRVHERGVGETLSCGTGAVAAAMAMRHWANDAGKLDTAPNVWRVHVPGGTLTVAAEGTAATLTGPAALVFSAAVTLD